MVQQSGPKPFDERSSFAIIVTILIILGFAGECSASHKFDTIQQVASIELSNEISPIHLEKSEMSHSETQMNTKNLSIKKFSGNDKNIEDHSKLLDQLQKQLINQAIRQQVADKDHLIMEKWLVDNVNDLHRELKQTEMEFEHFVQVTKNIMTQSEQQLRRQLAAATSLPLFSPLQTVPIDSIHRSSVDSRHQQQRLNPLIRMLFGGA